MESYIPPKRPYSFLAMLDDILDFAALSLVENGRLSFWMPTANDEDQEIKTPEHPCLEIVSVCTQAFNRCEFSPRSLKAQYFHGPNIDAQQGQEGSLPIDASQILKSGAMR
jgi:tRNA G10  N-methylase Trm11